MTGQLFGVGVGPGDPELMTLKAIRIIEESDIIFVPGQDIYKSVAYKIAIQAAKCLEEKEIYAIHMPMTKDKDILEKSHQDGAAIVISYLERGKQAAFLTLGDPTIYSTYLYIHKLVEAAGYQTQIINGIPSFCAAAARLNCSLVEGEEALHILPASYGVEEFAELSGTKVYMKAGGKIEEVKQMLIDTESEAVQIENCSMENERINRTVSEIREDAGYYSLIIAKKGRK